MNKSLLPKLRFPEFQDEWKNETLGNVYSFKVTNSFSRDQLNYENGSVKNIHYGDIHTKFSTLFDIQKEKVPFINPSVSLEKITPESFCVEGDIVFADASEDLNDVGKSIEIVNVNNEKLVSGMHTLLARQKEKKITVGFGGYLFKSDRIRLQIKKEAQGVKVLGVSANRLLNIDICFPSNKSEQQKIADCLTSLDDLIAAQSHKVEKLQAYKKGLMQNLFPAEGESMPRLRFPEFESAGEWEVKTLEDVCNMKAGEFISASDISEQYQDGLHPCYGGNGLRGYTKTFTHSGNYSLIGRQGALCGNVTFGAGQFHATEHAVVATPKNNIDTKWLFYTLVFLNLNQYATGQAQPGLSVTTLEKVKIVVPANIKEQQRIAELLSAVDEEISAQGEAVAALKVHKKGLMQGLFPSMSEVQE